MPSMQGSGSRRLMANPRTGDKCARAPQQCVSFPFFPLPQGDKGDDHFAFSAEAFLHSERNFLRSLPCSPLASACFEHSSEAAVRGFSAFFSAGAIFGAGVAAGAAGVAGAVVWANAELTSSKDAKAVAARREEIVIIESTSGWRSGKVALRC